MRKRGVFVFCITIVFLLIGFSSAGLIDWFGKITGKATQQNTNVTIAVTGTASVTIEMFNETLTGTTVDPISDSTKQINVTVRVTDTDGFSDINTTSVTMNFSRTGETTRINNTCSDLSQNTVNAKNFTCTIYMWYYDDSGTWTINAAAKDLGNGTLIVNSTMVFIYGSLKNIEMHPTQITFPSSAQAAVNVTANTPTFVNNTGNYNFTGINVTALNLYGETVTTVMINIANITIGNNTGLNSCDVSSNMGANATVLTNGTTTNVKHSILTRGNHSINNNQTGQEQIFYCFRTIPTGIQSQTYSSAYTGGQWIITAQQ